MIGTPGSGAAADAAAAGGGGQESWATIGRLLLADLVAVLRERFQLLALEGKQFALAAGALLALGVAAALLVLTAWFIVVAALIALGVHLGLPMAAALVLGAAANLAAAGIAWLAMRRQISLMTFSATLQTLHVGRARPAQSTNVPAETAPPPVAGAAMPGSARDASAANPATSAMRDDPLNPAPH